MRRTPILAALCLIIAACPADDAPIGEGAGGEGGNPPQFATSACGTCVLQMCAAQVETCNADPGCAAYLTCMLACPVGDDGDVDVSCEAACPLADSSTTRAQIGKLRFCREGGAGAKQCPACGNAPAVHPALDQTCQPSTNPDACFECEDENCCETAQACDDNPVCAALLQCAAPCLDAACLEACYAAHPDGVIDVGLRLSCLFALCGPECPGGNDPCAACTHNRCAYQKLECDSDLDCAMLNQCFGACLNPAQPDAQGCLNLCSEQLPLGATKFQDYLACIGVECVVECPYEL